MIRYFCIIPTALVALLPTAAHAQAVRGLVVDAGERPVRGVVVLLVDSTSQVAARALTDAQGQFRLTAARAGAYRIRTLRIGYRPTTSAPTALRDGEEVNQRIILSSLPLALDTVRIVGRNACRALGDTAAMVYALWEQVRTALIAAELTAAARTITATTLAYQRTLDPGPGRSAGRVLHEESNVSTGYVRHAWLTLPPDSLRRIGYVVTERDGTLVYYAPDLAMLLSAGFVADHCFRISSDARRPTLVGIAFEPTPNRRSVAEVRGTLWLDRLSSELRRLEFSYVAATRQFLEQVEGAGGQLDFVRLGDGSWVVNRWAIRMPQLEQIVLTGGRTEIHVAAVQVSGGALTLARRGADTLWAGERFTVSGSVTDSASGIGVAGARVLLAGTRLTTTTGGRGRFSLDSVLPGVYDVELHTAALDSLGVSRRVSVSIVNGDSPLALSVPAAQQVEAALCGGAREADDSGIVIGRARVRPLSDTTRPATRGAEPAGATMMNLAIVAEWRENATPARGTDSASARVHRLQTRGTADGSFRLCHLPLDATVAVRASTDSAETAEPVEVRFARGMRLARAELVLDRGSALASRGAVFAGVVVTDSAHTPIVGGEVALPELGKSVFTDTAGAFRIAGIPAGEQRIVIRRLGYGAADVMQRFRAGETVERRVVLGRAVTLEPVTVSARGVDRAMTSFEENRHVGLGHFVTRKEIAKYEAMSVRTVLQQIPGVGIVNGRTQGAWVTSRRKSAPLCPPGPPGEPPDKLTTVGKCLQNQGFYVPERYERDRGITIDCYSQVYLDGALMNGSREPTEPFDVSTIPAHQIEAIEFYAGPAETPATYARMGSSCGVLVLWTRRP